MCKPSPSKGAEGLAMLSLTTPSAINPHVQLLVDKIDGARSPVFLNLQHETYAIKAECYDNVNAKVGFDGGSVQYGWIVWYDPRYLIEGEFHAVWKGDDGKLVDITPKADGEKKVLFIPDDKTAYRKQYIDNIRISLSESPALQEILDANSQLTRMKNKFNDGTGHARLAYALKEHEANQSRNEKCKCGSGRKFKKCCGR